MATRARWIALTTAAFLVPPAAAQAQHPHNWSGFYIGLNAGAAWGRSDATSNVVCDRAFFSTDPSSYICGTASNFDSRKVAASGTGSQSKSVFTGGVQTGYNWQAGNFLYGTELDFGAFNLKASRSASGTYGGAFAPPPGTTYTIGSSVETDWLFTARGRIGWAFSNLLIYGTGGLAVTDLTVTNSFRDNSFAAASANGSASRTKAGWVLGGGAEWALGKNWTVKGEFLYLNFGSVTLPGLITGFGGNAAYSQGLNTSADLTARIARLGVNYKF